MNPTTHAFESPRMRIAKAAPAPHRALIALSKSIELDPTLRELVNLRTSIINGCAYCIATHTKDARQAGESEQRLYALAAWRVSPLFSDRERAVLALTDAITLISDEHVPRAVWEEAAALCCRARANTRSFGLVRRHRVVSRQHGIDHPSTRKVIGVRCSEAKPFALGTSELSGCCTRPQECYASTYCRQQACEAERNRGSPAPAKQEGRPIMITTVGLPLLAVLFVGLIATACSVPALRTSSVPWLAASTACWSTVREAWPVGPPPARTARADPGRAASGRPGVGPARAAKRTRVFLRCSGDDRPG
jgi:AhpD family alkylhydroperoxidase